MKSVFNKRLFCIFVVILLSLCLFSCSDKKSVKETNNNTNDSNVTYKDIKIEVKQIEDGKTLVFSRMIESVEDLKFLDLTDEYQSVCAIVFSLAKCENDIDVGIKMFEYINGPEDVSKYDVDFIKNQIDQYPYVMRSYFDNTSPNDDYRIKEISITIKENQYSRDDDGYVKLWLHSSGADSDRSVTVRKKGSTDEWFLFSDSYKGLMAGIRKSENEDKWA